MLKRRAIPTPLTMRIDWRLLPFLTLLQSSLASLLCYDTRSPKHPTILEPTNCLPSVRHSTFQGRDTNSNNPSDDDDDLDDRRPNLPFFFFAPDSPLFDLLTLPALPPPSWNDTQNLFFNVTCNKSDDFCSSFADTLDVAGWYVSQVSKSNLNYSNSR